MAIVGFWLAPEEAAAENDFRFALSFGHQATEICCRRALAVPSAFRGRRQSRQPFGKCRFYDPRGRRSKRGRRESAPIARAGSRTVGYARFEYNDAKAAGAQMTTSLAFTVIGPDRPGLVERLAATVADNDGNWLESRMAVLAGQFAGAVLATVPEAKSEALLLALMNLEHDGLRVMVEATPGVQAPRAGERVRLEVFGQDHPGIVRDITRVLSEQAVNIAEMETERSMGAMSAEAVFRLHADVELPDNLAAKDLRDALEVLAGDIMVEIDLIEEPETGQR